MTLTIGASLSVSGQPRREGGRAEFLGEANVDSGVDHDNIMVTASQGAFRAIQLRVENNTIQFQRVVVHFGNGQDERIDVRSRIPAGGSSRMIDLPGERRVIRSVELWYGRANWGRRRPKVTLWGFK